MNLIRALRAFLGERSEAAPAVASTAATPAPAPAAPPRAPFIVAAVGDAHPGGTLGALADSLSMPPLVDLCRVAGFRDAAGWAEALRRPMQDAGITSPRRVAAALANFSHETGGGIRLVESMDYSPAGATATFGKRATAEVLALCRRPGEAMVPIARQERIANLVYGGSFGLAQLGNREPGDGWLFRGGGLIQLTGRANYARVARDLGISVETLLGLVRTREGAADTACRWWRWAGVNGLADAGDIAVVRKRVNGGSVGLDDVRQRYQVVLAAG